MKEVSEMLAANRVIVIDRDDDGFAGEIHMPKRKGSVIASWGGGWEHVSVSPYNHRIMPSWDDMCYIKNLFWAEEECVVQYHPSKRQYVSNMPNCLHLWKPVGHDIEQPPSIMVGLRKGQSLSDAKAEINALIEAIKGESNG